jgi:hypothetical protein
VREPARSDAEARKRYLRHLRRSLSCLSASAVWRAGETAHAGTWVALTAPRVVTLNRQSEPPLYLRATQTFHYSDHPDYRGERKVSTDQYAYTLADTADISTELIAWHWQPEGGRIDPHLHIGHAHPEHERFTRWHVPTGRVAFEEILLFAINDLAVTPAHADWRAVLDDTLARFREFRSWP